MSSQHNLLASIRTLGSNYEDIIPFGIYLDDNEDITKLNVARLTNRQYLELIIIATKVIGVYVVFPILLFGMISKYFFP